MITMNAAEAMRKIEADAKEKVVREVRFVKKHVIGKFVRQGDIYLHMVAADHPHGNRTDNHQLAPGTSRGSRHIADLNMEVYEGTTLPSWVRDGFFFGPLVKVLNRGKIEHPEHPWCNLPAGCYQVVYQMDALTLRRVQD